MRILHVYRTYFPDTQGGLEEVIRQIAQQSRVAGAEVKIFTLSRNPETVVVDHDGVEVHRAKLSLEIASCGISLTGLKLFRPLTKWADIIHYHFPWPYADWLHLRAGYRRPALVTYHSDIVRQRVLQRIYRPLMTRFLQRIDAIVCTSPNYLATSQVLARYSNVEIIPIGLDESTYSPASDKLVDETAERFGRDYFLFVGVLRYYKGLHILLEAVRGAPYRVLIVGSGPTEQALMAQAERLQLDNVHFAGYVTNSVKTALFKLARGVVFPSFLRSEAFGVTLLEGAMYSKPLISTEVGSGTSHVNIDGITGLVVPPNSPSSLRQALDRLWSDPDAAEGMGRQARARYEELFTGELMGRRYMKLYQRVLDNTSRGDGAIERSTD